MADQRLAFVKMCEDGFSLAEACRQFNISRPTGYKILERYTQEGVSGLLDHSRAPHSSPSAVSQEQVAKVLELKAKHFSWGPKKIKDHLEIFYSDRHWPAASSIGDILKRAGLVKKRQLRPRCPTAPMRSEAKEANQLWCIDYKGQFRLGDGQWCYPLTITDRASRFLIRCQALPDVAGSNAWPYFVGAFEEYGLPEAILSDNGSPFASVSTIGLTSLSLKLIRLGIRLERIKPGKPQQNGAHERMHRTLKAEAISPVVSSMAAQQKRFDEWRHIFNHERPHQALERMVPATAYTPSVRPYPRRMPELQYPGGIRLLRVRPNGYVRWRGGEAYISQLLAGLDIGLDPFDERYHIVYVGHQPVSVFDEADVVFLHPKKAAKYLNKLRQDQKEAAAASISGG